MVVRHRPSQPRCASRRGEWVVFYDGQGDMVLRIPAKEVLSVAREPVAAARVMAGRARSAETRSGNAIMNVSLRLA